MGSSHLRPAELADRVWRPVRQNYRHEEEGGGEPERGCLRVERRQIGFKKGHLWAGEGEFTRKSEKFLPKYALFQK